MKNKTRITICIVLALLILAILVINIPITRFLEDTFNHGRDMLLKDGTSLLTFDSSGQLWVAGAAWSGKEHAIEVRTLENGSWISFTSEKNGLPSDVVKSIAADLHGKIWIGTWKSGLLMYDGEKWTTFTPKNSGLSTSHIADIEVDPSNRIWIRYGRNALEPIKGVTVIDGNDWQTFTTGNSDLLSDEVEAIAIDPEGRVWMGMRGDIRGVSILDDGQWISYTPEDSGLKADAIADIAFDAEGRAWIVTYGAVQGINIFDGKTWKFVRPDDLGVLEREWAIPSIHPDQDQRMWVSPWFGTKIYDGQNWLGLIGEDGGRISLDDMAVDEDGRIWLTTGEGLVALDREYPIATLWKTRQIRTFMAWGLVWILLAGLVCLLLGVSLRLSSPVAVALLAGAFTIIAWAFLLSKPDLDSEFINPGIFALTGALIGGMISQWSKRLAERAGRSRYIPLIAGYFIGLAIGFCQFLPYIFAQ